MPSNQSRDLVRQILCVSGKLLWRRPGRFSFLKRHRGDESITSPRDIDQVPMSFSSIAQNPSQCSNMNCEIGRLDVNVRPHPGHKFLFADQLARTFDQCEEDVERPTTDIEKFIDL